MNDQTAQLPDADVPDVPDVPDVIVTDQGGVRCIALNRPQSKNGLTLQVCAALISALESADRDSGVRAVMLTGRGEAFCSGLDLKAAMNMLQAQQAGDGMADAGEHMRKYFHGLIRAVRDVGKPVVALVDGAAAGFGCDLALACDLRLGTARARFGELFIKRGLMPDGGGTFMLPRLVGLGKALEMMFLGDMVDADEALRIGLLNRLVADEAEAMALLQRLAAGPPLVLREIKRAVYAGLHSSLDEALAAEESGQLRLLRSQDFAEGVTAFFMKRPPQFSGK